LPEEEIGSMLELSRQSFYDKDAERTSRFYDALHIHYERLGIFAERNPYVTSFGLLKDRIATMKLDSKIHKGVVLDAGCGAWQKGVRILQHFQPRRIEAVDFNERSVAHCKEDPQKDTSYSKQDLAALSFVDGTFDFIICEGVLHHTLDPRRTLEELIRVLKPGGCLSLGVYCWRFPYSWCSRFLKNTVKHMLDFRTFLSLSGTNKVMLIFADFIFVPIEHFINEKSLLRYVSARSCSVIYNDMMYWPIRFLGSRSRLFYKFTGLIYKHIFIVKAGG
jgi:SAM-dependent methyltransferase